MALNLFAKWEKNVMIHLLIASSDTLKEFNFSCKPFLFLLLDMKIFVGGKGNLFRKSDAVEYVKVGNL